MGGGVSGPFGICPDPLDRWGGGSKEKAGGEGFPLPSGGGTPHLNSGTIWVTDFRPAKSRAEKFIPPRFGTFLSQNLSKMTKKNRRKVPEEKI